MTELLTRAIKESEEIEAAEMLCELELLRKADDREIARLNKQLKSARVVIKRCAECLSPGSVRWLAENPESPGKGEMKWPR
jgi:hypothetical protein